MSPLQGGSSNYTLCPACLFLLYSSLNPLNTFLFLLKYYTEVLYILDYGQFPCKNNIIVVSGEGIIFTQVLHKIRTDNNSLVKHKQTS